VFYYLTAMNENYTHPAPPEASREGILRGMYRLRAPGREGACVQLAASGAILREAIAAAEALESLWGLAAGVWSVTSFTELRRDGQAAARWNRLHPGAEPRLSWVEQCLGSAAGAVVAASDYVSALADLIRPYVHGTYVALGTDGFGRSDTRPTLRRFFEVSREHIVVAALAAAGQADRAQQAIAHYRIDPESLAPWTV
jgi:pyruvate dehydrogenase E1 component